ncbi:hypothetical protein AJ80_03733 [Polytolypa hystricis UAMH7299]|uniref:Uncharacterized protein n=1 Tax=Polytolypa hystricis (strain UAMH7299) TaxID=1447883 RepID=A0A2B7YGC1_POLH7|nr:hypothetical protein AJ80_03733 [Polytolypa hystricis UAMH7299]
MTIAYAATSPGSYRSFAYATLGELIKSSGQWKQLNFITPGSGSLGFGVSGGIPIRRVPQPWGWINDLTAREGPYSEASVTIFRSLAPMLVGGKDILAQSYGLTWAQLVFKYYGVPECWRGGRAVPTERDTYRDVNEFRWNALDRLRDNGLR